MDDFILRSRAKAIEALVMAGGDIRKAQDWLQRELAPDGYEIKKPYADLLRGAWSCLSRESDLAEIRKLICTLNSHRRTNLARAA